MGDWLLALPNVEKKGTMKKIIGGLI
jgi:hypothetical protein